MSGNLTKQKLINSRDFYRHQFEHMKKVRAEGMKYQVENSSRQNGEVLQENERLNKELKSLEEKFDYYEKELVPKLKDEKSKLEKENEKLHSKLDNFLMAREDAEEELKMLKSRHSLVLDKALEDKELIEAANREREEFESKEKNLRESFNIEILELKKSIEKQKDELKGRHFEERERMRSVYEKKEQLRQSEIIELRHQNEKLKNQIRTVAMAISTPVPESRNTVPYFKFETVLSVEMIITLLKQPSTGGMKYNLNPVKKLKDNNSEASSSDKENRPVRQSPRQKRNTGPLLASTSLSSVHESADERRENYRERAKGKDHWEKPLKSSYGGRKLQTAAQILGSIDSLTSSGKSSGSKFFKAIDKEVSEIVQEINSMSEYVAATHCPNETPATTLPLSKNKTLLD
ncbi:hypothetical protein Avbf_03621 [Armadillidium vulgare]|nr:hypothetical protein Avbf_03621 [Armadillidium vulgare]